MCFRRIFSLITVSSFSDDVTDFAFNFFHDDILATSSQNGRVNLYRIPIVPTREGKSYGVTCQETTETNLLSWSSSEAESNLSHSLVKFHPTLESLVAVSSSSLQLFDLAQNKASTVRSFKLESDANIKSFDFDSCGKSVTLNGLDKALSVVELHDIRSLSKISVCQNQIVPNCNSRVLNVDNCVITSCINKNKHRVVSFWDVRYANGQPVTTAMDMQISNKIYVPLYDADCSLLYFVLKDENQVAQFEIANLLNGSSSFEINTNIISIPYTVKGAALASKRSMNVMQAEIDRLLVLSNQQIYPLSYSVPRKSYYTFHEDLYCETRSTVAPIDSIDQLSDATLVNTISLNPAITDSYEQLFRFGQFLTEKCPERASQIDNSITRNDSEQNELHKGDEDIPENQLGEQTLSISQVTQPRRTNVVIKCK